MEAVDKSKLMQIFGTKDLVDLFTDMDRENQSKILSTSFRKASKILISEAQNNLRGGFRRISGSFGVSFRKDIQALNVGSMKKRGGGFAHIVNAGTRERFYTSKNGVLHRTGKIIGNHFWDRAITSTEPDMELAIYQDIKTRFEKIIQKRNKVK